MFYAVLKYQWHITKPLWYKRFKYEIFRERKRKKKKVITDLWI